MESEEKALQAARLADGRKAEDIRLLDVHSVCNYTDYFLICTGRSRLQLQAIAEAVEEGLKAEGSPALAVDGRGLSSWIALDFGDLIVHILSEEARRFYALENLWGDAREVPLAGKLLPSRPSVAR